MTSSRLFTPIFVPDPLQEAVSDRAGLQAMLDVEAAFTRAHARARVIPARYLGSTDAFIDRALERHREAR